MMADLKRNKLKEKEMAAINKKYDDFFIIQIAIKYFNSIIFKRMGPFMERKFIKIYFKLLEDMFFTINAIHLLPPGLFLWSGKLNDFNVGLFGVLSLTFNLLSKQI